jgi:hypothetical protein
LYSQIGESILVKNFRRIMLQAVEKLRFEFVVVGGSLIPPKRGNCLKNAARAHRQFHALLAGCTGSPIDIHFADLYEFIAPSITCCALYPS